VTVSIGVTGYPRFGSLTVAQILTATLTFAVTCGLSCGPLAVEPEVSPLAWVPQAGPSRRPRCRHRAHGTPAAHCRRRFAHRSGHSRSTASAVLLMVASGQVRSGTGGLSSPLALRRVDHETTDEHPRPAAAGTAPSAQADESMPASGPRYARGPLPSLIRPSKRPLSGLPIHSIRCAASYK
jgi:hypothetical protein